MVLEHLEFFQSVRQTYSLNRAILHEAPAWPLAPGPSAFIWLVQHQTLGWSGRGSRKEGEEVGRWQVEWAVLLLKRGAPGWAKGQGSLGHPLGGPEERG